jgi:uncharacterized protein (TIGR02246 family)
MARASHLIAGFLLLPIVLSGCRIEIEAEEDTSLEPAVQEMLSRSAAAWNRGDLEAFIADYQDVPSTTFVGLGGVLSGVSEIRRHYEPSFAPGAERDSLRFESVQVRSLSPMIGIVTARWILSGDAVTRSSGPVTLIVRRTQAGWKITHDHSSTDPAVTGEN